MNFFNRYHMFDIRLMGQDASVILDANMRSINYVSIPGFLHFHEMWEIYFVYSGTLKVRFDDRIMAINGGCFALIPPGTRHSLHDGGGKLTHSHIRLEIAPSEQSSLTELLTASSLTQLEMPSGAVSQLEDIRSIYLEYMQTSHISHFGTTVGMSGDSSWPEICRSESIGAKLTLLLCTLIEAMVQRDFVPDPKAVKRSLPDSMIIEYIMLHNPQSDVTITNLAKNLGYSVEQTSRILRKRFGKSFRTLICEVNLERAKSYLTDTDFTVESIAACLGYKSAKSFGASFKALSGMTPAEYRRDYHANKDK